MNSIHTKVVKTELTTLILLWCRLLYNPGAVIWDAADIPYYVVCYILYPNEEKGGCPPPSCHRKVGWNWVNFMAGETEY